MTIQHAKWQASPGQVTSCPLLAVYRSQLENTSVLGEPNPPHSLRSLPVISFGLILPESAVRLLCPSTYCSVCSPPGKHVCLSLSPDRQSYFQRPRTPLWWVWKQSLLCMVKGKSEQEQGLVWVPVGAGDKDTLFLSCTLGLGKGLENPPSCPLTVRTAGYTLTICSGLNCGPRKLCLSPNPQHPGLPHPPPRTITWQAFKACRSPGPSPD